MDVLTLNYSPFTCPDRLLWVDLVFIGFFLSFLPLPSSSPLSLSPLFFQCIPRASTRSTNTIALYFTPFDHLIRMHSYSANNKAVSFDTRFDNTISNQLSILSLSLSLLRFIFGYLPIFRIKAGKFDGKVAMIETE